MSPKRVNFIILLFNMHVLIILSNFPRQTPICLTVAPFVNAVGEEDLPVFVHTSSARKGIIGSLIIVQADPVKQLLYLSTYFPTVSFFKENPLIGL